MMHQGEAAEIASLPILVRCQCTKCKHERWFAPQMLRFGIRHLECVDDGNYVQIPENTDK